jgi:hypothetical protein
MNRRYIMSAAIFALLLTAACNAVDDGSKRYPDYRYRLMVEVDTPEGLRSGSSVIEVKTAKSGKYSIPDPGKAVMRARGEAVTVDLGRRGMMFVLLRSEYTVDWATRALISATRPVTYAESKAAGLRPDYSPTFDMVMQRTLALTGRHDVPRYVDNKITRGQAKSNNGKLPSNYPIMVRFADLADPKSVERVDPDDLAHSFGSGVKLRRITVERTEDEVTEGLRGTLPWLAGQTGSLVKYGRLTPIKDKPIEHRLTEGDFERN